jgi:hypothetical protein
MPRGAHRATAAGGESAAHRPAGPTATSLRHDGPRFGGSDGREYRPDAGDLIATLADLRDRGAISDADFQRGKDKILSQAT